MPPCQYAMRTPARVRSTTGWFRGSLAPAPAPRRGPPIRLRRTASSPSSTLPVKEARCRPSPPLPQPPPFARAGGTPTPLASARAASAAAVLVVAGRRKAGCRPRGRVLPARAPQVIRVARATPRGAGALATPHGCSAHAARHPSLLAGDRQVLAQGGCCNWQWLSPVLMPLTGLAPASPYFGLQALGRLSFPK